MKIAFCIASSIVAALFLWTGRAQPAARDAVETAVAYVQAVYARDFKEAYRFISSEDRRLKDEESYVRERGAFGGFTSGLTKRLAGFIEAKSVEKKIDGNRAQVKLKIRFPDAGNLSADFLDWDEERLNQLSPKEQEELLEKLDRWEKGGKIPTTEGKYDYKLVREDSGWRIFLNWAAEIRVSFDAVLPGPLLEAKPLQKEFVVMRGKVFNVFFKVRNLSSREVYTWIEHHVEPKEMWDYMELTWCTLLYAQRIEPGKAEVHPSAYVIRGDLPEGVRHLKVTYEFKVEER